MMISDHPQLEDLLLWRTGELNPSEADALESHLQQCSICQDVFNDIQSIIERVVRIDTEAERRRIQAVSRNRGAKVFRSRTFMGTTASVVIGALLFVTSTQWTPEARAESLLNKAVQEQARKYRRVRFLKIESSSLSCNVAFGTDNAPPQLVSVGATNFCENVSSHLATTGRQWNNLLSAESFQQWRHSLTKKRDSVRKSADTIEVSTVTDEGLLREARLRMRSSDYRPVAAHLEFAGAEPLSIDVDENEERTPVEIGAHPSGPSATSAPGPQIISSPIDETEAQIRLALHRAHLDSNILLAVDRRGSDILVWGVVPSETERAAINAAVQNLPRVQVSVRTEAEQRQEQKPLPWSSFEGEGAPLAYDQLRILYPDDGPARQEFQNELDSLTRSLVGEAKARDALLALHSQLATTQYDQQLESATVELADSMRRDTLALAIRLAPLTGSIAHAGESLSYRQAMKLYKLVHEMALADDKQDRLQLSQTVSQTRRLLARR